MAQLDGSTSQPQTATALAALNWINALTLLSTIVAVTVLAVTGNTGYLGPVIAIGTGALAIGGTVHVRIHIQH
ncbi:hypothetical protein G3I40_19355 [Streptomyces sp. SID14478]|uniref:hypothetical protein n=1 Tax=Streptomyces sp. SID14478 TaxID=2706073 RepID=UPI0013D94FDA|nr:hypothetical protein [Streptomyces sp. SID14478]NEB77361.1 hypothetical protein [Streptomyces sp. SID14478]